MFKTILVPIDASAIAKFIFIKALNVAKATGAKLILINVVSMDDENAPAPMAFSTEYTRNRVTGEYATRDRVIQERKQQWQIFKKKRLDFLSAMKDEALSQDIQAEILQVSGDPGSAICQQAQKLMVDLIVIGRCGVSAVEKLVLGSVSSYVVHNASCSVLIVRGSQENLKWQNILVAVDSSARAKNIFDSALTLAKLTKSDLTLLEVLSIEELEQAEETADELLETREKQALAQDINVKSLQVVGSPGKSICQQAQVTKTNLIVMGRRDRSSLQKLILGSVSNYVIHHAFCSVLIIRSNE